MSGILSAFVVVDTGIYWLAWVNTCERVIIPGASRAAGVGNAQSSDSRTVITMSGITEERRHFGTFHAALCRDFILDLWES